MQTLIDETKLADRARKDIKQPSLSLKQKSSISQELETLKLILTLWLWKIGRHVIYLKYLLNYRLQFFLDEAAIIQILKGLLYLFFGIHDYRASPGYWFMQRFTAKKEHSEPCCICFDGNTITILK